jgi:hypothetical protein
MRKKESSSYNIDFPWRSQKERKKKIIISKKCDAHIVAAHLSLRVPFVYYNKKKYFGILVLYDKMELQ